MCIRDSCYDVAEHTIQALMHSAPEKTLRLALLFHDMGKAKTRTTDQDGVDHFHGHSEVSAELARTILRRLKFDNETIDRVVRLVRAHDVKIEPGERNMRFALNRLGPDLFPELFLVKEADLAAQSDYQREEKQEHLRKMQEDYEAVIASGACPVSYTHLHHDHGAERSRRPDAGWTRYKGLWCSFPGGAVLCKAGDCCERSAELLYPATQCGQRGHPSGSLCRTAGTDCR